MSKYIGIDGFSYYLGSKFSRKMLSLLFRNTASLKIPANFIISGLIKDFYHSLLYNPLHSGPITDNESLELRNKYHIQRNPEKDKSVGFKLMYDQLNEYKILENLLKSESCKIIHLIRNNVLKIYLSRLTRRKRGVAHSASKVEQIKVYVDPGILFKYIQQTLQIKNQMKEKFSDCEYLEVYYEEFINNYNSSSEKIFDFLEVENADVRMPLLKKLNPDSSRDIILNYDEVSEALKHSPYANFLD